MSSIIFPNQQPLVDWPYRVCLPYGIDLLQLARWLNAARERRTAPQFGIVVGEQSHAWSGSDAIALFSEIQTRCINYSLSHSYVTCNDPQSVMFFDIYSRFSFFSADLEALEKLYPFSREIMWENFVLLQEEDDDIQLEEIFHTIQSV